MRRALLAATLLGGLALPSPAVFAQSASATAPARPTPLLVPATPSTETAVQVRGGQEGDFGRLTFQGNDSVTPVIHRKPEGMELRFPGRPELDLSTLRQKPQFTAIETRTEGNETVALLRTACSCEISTGNHAGIFFVDFRETHPTRTPRAKPAKPADRTARGATVHAAAQPPRTPAPQAPATTVNPAPPAAATPSVPTAAAPPPPTSAAPGKATGPLAMDEADRLRADLAAKLAILNGTPLPPPPGAPAGTQPAAPTAEPAQPVAPPPMPVCRPAFDLAAWKGNASFPDRLRDLRNAAALGTEGASEMAALAEFYTAYGLTAEALDTLAAWHAEDPLPAERARLDRVTALAHLLRHEPPDPASPLFAEGQGCEREDLPMWRAAAAAVAGDTTQVRKYAGRARALLRDVPDPLRGQIALLIASGAPNDVETQRAMAAVLRTADAPTPEDDAARLLVQARLARAEGSTGDEITFLERAGAITGGAVPALQARARLVAINASREGPVSAGVETALTDIARTYRYEQIGQDASEALAETRLRRGDYAGALSAADDGTLGLRGGESRGAALTARILRTLLVDPGAAALPPPAERMALFWRYEGYATPGERGDDIRLGAARLMLDQRMPESALDVLRQLSPGTAATPPAVTLRALAEARAANGNPQGALALLANTPPSDDTRRAAATALGRLGRAADAAAQLEGMNQVADRLTRAELLMRANDWAGAATTYAGLLADPTLTPEIRRTATDRAALASALAGRAPAALPRDLAGASPAAARALGTIAIPPAALGAPVEAVRDALERARRIETLLSP